MATAFRIRDWNAHFETHESRKVETLKYVMLPVKHDGDGYSELVDHPDGPAHYGAWCAILGVAAKSKKPRGELLRDGREPHDSKSLSRKTRIQQSVIEAAIPRLLSIGWLEEFELTDKAQPPTSQHDALTETIDGSETSRASPAHLPDSPGNLPRVSRNPPPNLTELNRTELNRKVIEINRTEDQGDSAGRDSSNQVSVLGSDGRSENLQLKEVLRRVKRDKLADPQFLLSLYVDCVVAGAPDLADTELDALKFLTLADHCITANGINSPPATFVASVRDGDYSNLSTAEENRARIILKRLRRAS